MPEPILAAQNTWFSPNVSTVTRASITEIEIMDSYTPDASVTVVDTWDASAAKDGSVTCYVIGTKLIISGNGSRKVYANADSRYAFSHTTPDGMFTNVTTFANANFLDMSKCANAFFMFGGMLRLTTLNVSNWDVSICEDMSDMFAVCTSLNQIDVSNWDTSSCTNMYGMFDVCSMLSTIDVSNWDTSSCINMAFMFDRCSSLTNLDVSKWNTSNCTDMQFMFYECSSLKEIDVSNWDTSKVTTLDHFAAHANLKRKGMGNWNTSSLVNANAAFHNCAEEELDLSGWDVSKVQFFCQMFENSPNLKRIKGLENWDTSAGLGFDGMFERCGKLEELDLSSFDTTKAKNGVSASTNGHKTATLNNMFLSCNNLEKVTVGANFSVNGDGTNTTAANKAILPTPSATYIPGADGNWYTFNGDQYAPNAMQDKTAATYYASFDMVADADVIVKNGSLIDTAKAIREKNGTTTQYTPSEFGAAIRALT